MNSLTPEILSNAFKKLGAILAQPDEALQRVIVAAPHHNPWFTEEMTQKAVAGLAAMLEPEAVDRWMTTVRLTQHPKKIGLVLAGNIPMVGFHDILSVLATGNIAQIKLSSQDDKLLPAVLNMLLELAPDLKEKIVFTDRLADFDAVIATGNNNSSRYFEHYFGKVPHIIRRNRNSVAVLTGNETPEEISRLGNDIFDYFGLGCRNVSKLFLPEGYAIKNLFEPIEHFQPIANHFKYNNNYDYNKSIFLVNLVEHYDNGFVLLKEDKAFASPLAVVYFEYYKNLAEVEKILEEQADNVQCIVSGADLDIDNQPVAFGNSQQPALWDYADNIDTVAFLNGLDA